MEELGRRSRTQPAPPHIVFESLMAPHQPHGRPWLALERDETEPVVLDSTPASSIVWASLWPEHPDLRLEFDLSPDGGGGTRLEWVLRSPEPLSDGAAGHLRHRINELVNRDLRLSFGG